MNKTKPTFDVKKNPDPLTGVQRELLLANPGWGRVLTDHMVTLRYSEGHGWQNWRSNRARRSISTPPPPSSATRSRFSRA
jgi:branched-chain amino acid aminotransferase